MHQCCTSGLFFVSALKDYILGKSNVEKLKKKILISIF